MSEALELLPLGVGDAFSARWYSSCLALRHGARWLLVDCPHPIRKMMREAREGLDLFDVEAVAQTHLHADHASGLEGYGYFCHFALQRKARLAAFGPVLERLWDGHLSAGMERLVVPGASRPARRTVEDYFELITLSVDRPTALGPFTLECRPTRHHIPTTAFKITAGDRTLAYSADTAFDPALIAWLDEGSDLIVHETNYGTHTPYAELASLDPALRAKMRLIHYPDDFDLDASVIEPLRQGRALFV